MHRSVTSRIVWSLPSVFDGWICFPTVVRKLYWRVSALGTAISHSSLFAVWWRGPCMCDLCSEWCTVCRRFSGIRQFYFNHPVLGNHACLHLHSLEISTWVSVIWADLASSFILSTSTWVSYAVLDFTFCPGSFLGFVYLLFVSICFSSFLFWSLQCVLWQFAAFVTCFAVFSVNIRCIAKSVQKSPC